MILGVPRANIRQTNVSRYIVLSGFLWLLIGTVQSITNLDEAFTGQSTTLLLHTSMPPQSAPSHDGHNRLRICYFQCYSRLPFIYHTST